jgi:hypothetical protein
VQIDIDFEVFKALTTLRESESVSYNDVLRRLLNLGPESVRINSLREFDNFKFQADLRDGLPKLAFGIWYQNKHFPEGTEFRATYKGRTYLASIKDCVWVGEDGLIRRSPSDAARAISGTNVNGWRFWHAKIPGSECWNRLDKLKQ